MAALGRVAGGMAHDINNILGAIEGYAALILAALAPDDPIRPDVEEILKAEQHAARITKRVQVFNRQYSPKKNKADINQIVAGLEPAARGLAGEKITVLIETGPGLKPVYGDAKPLEQAFIYLVLNAAEAMPSGGTIKIKTWTANFTAERCGCSEPPPEGSNYAAISVTDTGAGMTAETMERMYEPFFTTKTKRVGRGLGLSEVYGIVRQHNGWLEVQSEPGKGSTFNIYFPEAGE